MSLDFDNLAQTINLKFPDSITEIISFRDETTFRIKKDRFIEIFKYLKSDFDFTFLADITAVDYLEVKDPRFELVYHLHRFGENCEENDRLRIKTDLDADDLEIGSVAGIWRGADWLEREVYDMFGIKFLGHPDLRRILMPEDYGPFPLRKDFDVRDRKASKECFEKALEEGSE